MELKGKEKECFTPEKDNPYPLCIGGSLEECRDCQLRADWELEDPYGIERQMGPCGERKERSEKTIINNKLPQHGGICGLGEKDE